ncbi:MAG TPA: hypothetical protein VKZ41_01415 [Gemmatimonadales bacterium]|nr:hypothetical protein [Gemmatimonadales bacterium]
MANLENRGTTDLGGRTPGSADWSTERNYWEKNFRNRPYAHADRGFEHYEPGYRYGTEAATRYRGRKWNEVENDLRSGWDRYEHRGANQSTWENIKDSVRDAWDRMTGEDDGMHTKHDRR